MPKKARTAEVGNEASSVYAPLMSQGGWFPDEFDTLTGTWVELDSATIAERIKVAEAIAAVKRKERFVEQAHRIFGPEWPYLQEPIRMLNNPIEDEAYGYLNEGKVREAEKAIRVAQRENSGNAHYACTLADIYAMQMRLDTSSYRVRKWYRKAENAYRAAARMDRSLHRTNFNWGLLYIAYLSKCYEVGLDKSFPISTVDRHKAWWAGRLPIERAYLINPDHEPTAYLLDRWYDNIGLSADEKEHEKKTVKRRLRRQGELP